MPLYINFPSWIHPEIFPGVPVLGMIRWYGLMYIFAFGTAYLILTLHSARRATRAALHALSVTSVKPASVSFSLICSICAASRVSSPSFRKQLVIAIFASLRSW